MQFTQFLSSIKSLKTNNKKLNRESDVGFEEKNNSRASGFVFVKDSGVYDNDFSAIQEAKSLNSIRTALENLEDQLEFFHVVPGVVKEAAAPQVSGPWGGGKPWDDGVFSGVKKIFLTEGEAIYCIQIKYDRNGQSVWSVRHGGGSEGSSNMIEFDYPDEFLTSVCGYNSSPTGDDRGCIKSLTFHTNKAKYGPYGEETGTFFTSSKTEGKIVGFHGRSGCYLNAIGVHLQQRPNDLSQQGLGERGGPVKMIMNKFFN